MEKVAVIGAGAWGTTLALLLHRNGKEVFLREKFPDYCLTLRKERSNPRFLPGIPIPESISLVCRLSDLPPCDACIIAAPSFAFRATARELAAAGVRGPFLIATKGLEKETGLRMSQVLAAETGAPPFAVLSGPTIAGEVARGLPAGAVCAGHDAGLNMAFRSAVATDAFRVYTGGDPLGVEIAGALKNPLAIAAGIAEGLGLGENARATLVCRGLAEMTRLGRALGGEEATFAGLSGLGDLVTTCFSPLSRNHRFGLAVGRGERPEDLIRASRAVIEGCHTAGPALELAARNGVEMPITAEVARVLLHGKNPAEAVRDLMNRPPGEEFR